LLQVEQFVLRLFHLHFVNAAIQLDDQPLSSTIEIHDVRANGMLPAEFEAT
jgi:hypothetical protein